MADVITNNTVVKKTERGIKKVQNKSKEEIEKTRRILEKSKGKRWSQRQEMWGIYDLKTEKWVEDEFGAIVAFESVEDAKHYALDYEVVLADRQLATTSAEAERTGITAEIRTIRVMVRL